MRAPVKRNTEYTYRDEDDLVEIEFSVEFEIAPSEPRTRDYPGSPGGIEDVTFKLSGVSYIDSNGVTGSQFPRDHWLDEAIAAWERQMESRYVEIPEIRREVDGAIFASLERD